MFFTDLSTSTSSADSSGGRGVSSGGEKRDTPCDESEFNDGSNGAMCARSAPDKMSPFSHPWEDGGDEDFPRRSVRGRSGVRDEDDGLGRVVDMSENPLYGASGSKTKRRVHSAVGEAATEPNFMRSRPSGNSMRGSSLCRRITSVASLQECVEDDRMPEITTDELQDGPLEVGDNGIAIICPVGAETGERGGSIEQSEERQIENVAGTKTPPQVSFVPTLKVDLVSPKNGMRGAASAESIYVSSVSLDGCVSPKDTFAGMRRVATDSLLPDPDDQLEEARNRLSSSQYEENSVAGRLSENWCMLPRYGFPRSTDSFIVSAEIAALPALLAAQQECERQWLTASKGLPLLANIPPSSADELRKLARKFGLPPHMRAIMWLTLSGVALKMDENDFFCAALLKRHGYMQGEHGQAIQRDLERTFPEHPYFSLRDGGLLKLKNVLHALCWRNPLLNYCQSFNFLVALTLLVIGDEEATFWLLCHILETLLPNDFYGESLIGAKVDQRILPILITKHLPRLASYFHEINFDIGTLVPAWILSLFINVFPVGTVLRVWDYLVTDIPPAGQPSVVPLAIVLGFLKIYQEELLRCEDSGDVIMFLSRTAKVMFNATRLLSAAKDVKLTGTDLLALRRRFKGSVMEESHKKKMRLSEMLRQRNNASTSTTPTSSSPTLPEGRDGSPARSPFCTLPAAANPQPHSPASKTGGGGELNSVFTYYHRHTRRGDDQASTLYQSHAPYLLNSTESSVNSSGARDSVSKSYSDCNAGSMGDSRNSREGGVVLRDGEHAPECIIPAVTSAKLHHAVPQWSTYMGSVDPEVPYYVDVEMKEL